VAAWLTAAVRSSDGEELQAAAASGTHTQAAANVFFQDALVVIGWTRLSREKIGELTVARTAKMKRATYT
jgi:hypothetical protein